MMYPIQADDILAGFSLTKSYPVPQTLLQILRRVPKQRLFAVNQVDLTIKKGEIVGLIGESGCGKTTLGKILCKLTEDVEGKLFFEQQSIDSLSEKEFRPFRKKIQMLFQNPYSTLNPKQTVLASLHETLLVNTDLQAPERKTKIDEMLKQVHLVGKEHSLPTELSGGERRRVGLAKVLLLQPLLVVADEPVAGLDSSIKSKIIDLMLELKTSEMSYLFISHDLHVIRYVADRVFVMFLGKIVEEMSAEFFQLDFNEDHPHHPYTETLLTAAKQISLQHSMQQNLSLIENQQEEKKQRKGCVFANRCPFADEYQQRCFTESPSFTEIQKGHRIACHRFEPKKGRNP